MKIWKRIIFIDCGGTPEYVLRYDKISYIVEKGIPAEKIIVVRDPFDLSRDKRTFWLGKELGKIRFNINVKDVSLSADFAPAPDENQVADQFKAKGISLPVPKAATLREFMNLFISTLDFRGVKKIFLEDVLSQNPPSEGNARAVCPACGCFRKMCIGEKTPCCAIPWAQVRSYIPEKSVFKKTLNAAGLLSPTPLIDKSAEVRTMYESYLLSKEK
jgi:hypothetical protein